MIIGRTLEQSLSPSVDGAECRSVVDRQAPIGPIASASPTSPELVGGRMMLPADLQRLHRFILDTDVIEVISDEMREVVETVWPELVDKLPPKQYK